MDSESFIKQNNNYATPFTYFCFQLCSFSYYESATILQKAMWYYTCSMDPQVVEYKPGKCPIWKWIYACKEKEGKRKMNTVE
jgi:hypothetical protein